MLKELIELHGNVVFGGDGYSSEWHKSAVEERGLKNLPTTADALPELCSEEVIKLFSEAGVFTPVELQSRYEVYSEQYILSIEVEAKLITDMAKTIIYPAAMGYLSDISETSLSLKEIGVSISNTSAQKIAGLLESMMDATTKLEAALNKHDFADTNEHMQYLAYDVRALMDDVREHADALEGEVSDEVWPLPKYREMLFIK